MWRLVVETFRVSAAQGSRERKGKRGKDISCSRRNNMYVYNIGVALYNHFDLLVNNSDSDC